MKYDEKPREELDKVRKGSTTLATPNHPTESPNYYGDRSVASTVIAAAIDLSWWGRMSALSNGTEATVMKLGRWFRVAAHAEDISYPFLALRFA